MRRLLVFMCLCMALMPASASAIAPRANLLDVESDVMCPTCHEPLVSSGSPQAEEEKAYIARLIARGLTKGQVERELVSQYGPQVLGRPPARGFNLTLYVLPAAGLVAGVALLCVTLPGWRRRSRAAAGRAAEPSGASRPPGDEDAARLERELAVFDG